MSQRIVINARYGGFSLSQKAQEKLKEWGATFDSCYEIERDDPLLIRVVEELGEEANEKHAELKIVEIPDGVSWVIEEYDGLEHVAEVHRTWS